MVRLVFRPYTQLRRSICTSESLRTSIRVSPDFVLARHSSPSFGSQRVRSGCATSQRERDAPGLRAALLGTTITPKHQHKCVAFTFISPLGFAEPNDSRTC